MTVWGTGYALFLCPSEETILECQHIEVENVGREGR